MPKNPKITDEAKLLIQRFYKRHPGWTAKDIQIRVSQELHRRNPQLPLGWPGLSSVQKELAKIKNRNPDPRDEPWSFGSLAEYPIAPEAIPLVVSIYEKCSREGDEDWLPSIREALWIGRLHKIVELYKPKHILPDVRLAIQKAILSGRKRPIELGEHPTNRELAEAWGLKGKEIPLEDIVLDWAYIYSQYEIMSELEGKPFDSSELDSYMMVDVYEFYGERQLDFVIGTAKEKECHTFAIPKEEAAKIFSEEELNYEVIGPRGDFVFLRFPDKDANEKIWRKLAQYETFSSKPDKQKKEAHNERPYSKEG